MYTVVFTKKALSFFEKLERVEQKQIVNALERIQIRPEQFLIKLIGEEGYKLRVGDYRLFIDLSRQKLSIIVITIKHRRNAYK